jgi:hypothetical protein
METFYKFLIVFNCIGVIILLYRYYRYINFSIDGIMIHDIAIFHTLLNDRILENFNNINNTRMANIEKHLKLKEFDSGIYEEIKNIIYNSAYNEEEKSD